MKIRHAMGCPYEDYENAAMVLEVQLEANETVSVGDEIRIEMMDDSFIEREVKIINPKKAGDFYPVSKEARESDCARSKKPVLSVTGECYCTLIVLDCHPRDVKTQENIDAKAFSDERIIDSVLEPVHIGIHARLFVKFCR